MILPAVAEIRALSPADSIRAALTFMHAGGVFSVAMFPRVQPENAHLADWFGSILENDPLDVVETIGTGVRELLIAEREKMDRGAT